MPQDGAPVPVEATSDALGRLVSLALLGAALGAALGAPVALQF